METTQSGEMLQVTIRDNFDFTLAHRLLTVCHAVVKAQGATHIEIVLDHLTRGNPCAIGALLLLVELAPERLHIKLHDCHPDAQAPLHCAPLGQYFAGALQPSPLSSVQGGAS